ncbi:ABC transporter permease [Psychrobacillus sp. OK032]|uniref:ABC transporter permease n=1 Tax=Psychrobacillus sp. OK032 TaxID=1884358 RepID=UPI0008CECFAD|nr:ABC transporter permease [Psychrobacillus sp. OK032]SES25694.1 sulfonate transport system permease protein [Psychrobacillus sp. OK032]
MSKKDIELTGPLVLTVKERKKRAKRTSANWSAITLSLVIPILLLAVWSIVTFTELIPSYQLPSPIAVVETIVGLAQDGSLWSHLGITFSRVIIGSLIGTIIAVLLGSVVGFYSKAERLFDPIIQAFKSIPSLAWVPLFILWMGIGEPSKISLIAVGVFFPVYLNMVSGILNVDRKLIEVGKVYGLSHFELVRRIILPATFPSFFTGLRSGLGLGWMFVVAAELMGASQGLGYLLVIGQNSSSPDLIIASIFLFAVVGKCTDWLVKIVENKVLSWRDNSVIGG